jgi:Kef-type K+ transport system membrane component KefB
MPRNRPGGRRIVTAILLVLGAWTATALASSGQAESASAQTFLWLAVILIAAQAGGDLAARIGQPAVLGELAAGVIIGNLHLAGVTWFAPLASDPSIELLARLGVLLLLFEVGLESTVSDMLEVGGSAVLVATLGVITPFALGWVVGAWLMPASGPYVHAFLGATLSATSVGITARVLKDLGRSRSSEARIILGAAVVDDVMGLVILAVVTGLVGAASSAGTFSARQVIGPLVKASVFLVGSLAVGALLSRRLLPLAARLRSRGVLLALGLSACFLLAWLADAMGLAAIVGAFAAGLLLEDTHYQEFVERGERGLEELVHPITTFLAPIFFVLMGVRTDLGALFHPQALALGSALVVAAVVGKQACSLGVLGKGVDRLSVGIGMIPRGEVGLIFANVGLELRIGGEPVISTGEFSAVVVMVIVTTLITPPLLKWSFGRRPRPAAGSAGS